MLILPRKELILPTVKMNVGIKGYFRVQIRRPDGRCRWDSGFFPNLLLTSGRNQMGQSDFMDYCQVGTDNTAPAAGQTALQAHHQGTNTITSDTAGGESVSSPYYGWRRKTFRFPVGVGPANLSEVGVGWGSSGSTLLTRALILDPVSQTPTTVSPLVDELLDVTYELRYYNPTSDVTTPSVTLDGTVYDTVTRAANSGGADWYTSIGEEIGVLSGAITEFRAFDGAIGTLTGEPSGSQADAALGSIYNTAYSNNSYEREVNIICGSSGWNLGSGIRCIRLQTTGGAYQTSFTSNPGGNTIPKTSSFTMTMAWKLAWAERP